MRWAQSKDPVPREERWMRVCVLVLLLPAGLLALGGLGSAGDARTWYVGGAAGVLVLAAVVLRFRKQRPWRSPTAVLPAAAAIIVQGFGPHDFHSAFSHFMLAVLGLNAVGLFAIQSVLASGAPALRQARPQAPPLSAPKRWPADL